MTDSTPIPALEGPHGLAYFTNPNDPTLEARMAAAAHRTLDHAPKSFGYVTERISEALADTPYTRVELWHTGGGCFTIYALMDTADSVDPFEVEHLVAGPFGSDPDPEDMHDVSVAWCRDYEDDGTALIRYPFGDHVMVDGIDFNDEDCIYTFTDLTHYASLLADAFKGVAEARTTGRAAVILEPASDDWEDRSRRLEEIRRYMPANYSVEWDRTPDDTLVYRIVGHDVAGWTLDGYVLPRLASGLIAAEEVPFA